MDEIDVLTENPDIAEALARFREIDDTGHQMTALAMMVESMDRELVVGAKETLGAAAEFGVGLDETYGEGRSEARRGYERAQAIVDFYDAIDEIE